MQIGVRLDVVKFAGFDQGTLTSPAAVTGLQPICNNRRRADYLLPRRRESAWRVFYSGRPSPLSFATTTLLPTPTKRPRILFWSRQNSKAQPGDFDLLIIKVPLAVRASTIRRPRPRPCVRPSQRCFPIFSQASRIAAEEWFGLFMIDLPGSNLHLDSGPLGASRE